jgi:hypothetical protein
MNIRSIFVKNHAARSPSRSPLCSGPLASPRDRRVTPLRGVKGTAPLDRRPKWQLTEFTCSLVLSSKVRQRLVPTLAPLFYASRCATMIMPAGAAWPHSSSSSSSSSSFSSSFSSSSSSSFSSSSFSLSLLLSYSLSLFSLSLSLFSLSFSILSLFLYSLSWVLRGVSASVTLALSERS